MAASEAGGAPVLSVNAAARLGEAIVLAVPWPAVPAAIEACGDLAGRVLIDATNPLRFIDGVMELAVGFDTSAGEQIAALAKGARVVKTLNQVGAEVMDKTDGYPAPPVMFVASDDADAKALAMGLVRDLGFDAQDSGALRGARLLEPMAMLWIDQVVVRGTPMDCAFGLMMKG
jgi:predicted dinucleotide-binding enzyme